MGWNSITLHRAAPNPTIYNDVLIPFFATEMGKIREHRKSLEHFGVHGMRPDPDEFYMELYSELQNVIDNLKRIMFLLSEKNPKYRGMTGGDKIIKDFIQRLESEEVRLG